MFRQQSGERAEGVTKRLISLCQYNYPSARKPWQKGILHCWWKPIVYCLSYTAVLWNFLPFESVPLVVTVRVLPSAETAMRPEVVTLPPFLTFNPSVRSSIFLYDRVSS